jgi:hypothetical protein
MEIITFRRAFCLQIWRAAANIFNKQSQTAYKGWSSSLRVRFGATNSSPYNNKLVTKCHKGPRTWTNSLDKRPKLSLRNMRFGTCNVRSRLYRTGSKRKLDLVGVQEVRWDGGGTESAGEYTRTFLYGKGSENHELGTGFVRT